MRIEYFDSLLAFNPADRARIIFRKAVYLRNMGKRIEALNAFKEAYAEGNMLPEKDRLESLYAIGMLYYDLGNPVKALGETANLMALPKPDSLKYYNVKGLVTIYNVYITIRNIKGALNALKSGLHELERIKDITDKTEYRRLTGLLLIMSGGTNSLSGNYKEAFENYKEAEKYVGKEHNGDITLSLGILYSYMQEHDIAHNYYQKAVEDTT